VERGDTTQAATEATSEAPVVDRTEPLPEHDDARVLLVAMRTAVAMLGSGAQSDDVEAAIRTIATAYGMVGAQASVTFSGISISYVPNGRDHPTTVLHIVRERRSDFARLATASALIRRIRDGECSLADAEAALNELESQASPYGRLASFVAPGVSAAGSTVVFGGNVPDAAATLGIALAVQPALERLDRSTLPPFFRLVFGAAVSTLLVALLVALGLPIVGGLVLTGSLLRFLPGYALVSGFRDLIDQSIISGTARLAEALLLAAGVALGTAVGVVVAGSLHIQLAIVTVGRADWSALGAGLAAFVAVGAFAIQLGVPRSAVAQAALLGASAWVVFIGFADIGAVVEPVAATLGSALAIGIAGRILARRAHAPAALWVVPAILPLLPGLQLVQALLANTDAARVSGLVGAAATAFLIGTGVATGDIIVLTVRGVRDTVVAPAIGAVTGGVDVLIVSRVERAVEQARGSRSSTRRHRAASGYGQDAPNEH
jgi:uncharacterized membrane protein YjjP (DUF1212 family)